MCDEDIHPGLIEDWRVTRRAFVATGIIAAGAAGCAPINAAGGAGVAEREVAIETPDGSADAVFFHPASGGPHPAVLMWPDIMGLRPAFRDMGRRLAGSGYSVLVPNPFYRSARAPVMQPPIDFSDPDTRQVLVGYRRAMTDSGVDGDARAYLGWLDAQDEVASDAGAGVQGYCMGGPLSFRTAAAVPSRIRAVGSFHGGGLVTEEPSSPHLLIPQTNAAYLVAVAQNDDAREPEAKTVLREAFDAAGRPATVEVYPADHGWCVPGSQVYDQQAAERAWAELLSLYGRALV